MILKKYSKKKNYISSKKVNIFNRGITLEIGKKTDFKPLRASSKLVSDFQYYDDIKEDDKNKDSKIKNENEKDEKHRDEKPKEKKEKKISFKKDINKANEINNKNQKNEKNNYIFIFLLLFINQIILFYILVNYYI